MENMSGKKLKTLNQRGENVRKRNGSPILRDIQDHLKVLREIKRDLKKDPIGTPLRKKDRISVDSKRVKTRQKK